MASNRNVQGVLGSAPSKDDLPTICHDIHLIVFSEGSLISYECTSILSDEEIGPQPESPSLSHVG